MYNNHKIQKIRCWARVLRWLQGQARGKGRGAGAWPGAVAFSDFGPHGPSAASGLAPTHLAALAWHLKFYVYILKNMFPAMDHFGFPRYWTLWLPLSPFPHRKS